MPIGDYMEKFILEEYKSFLVNKYVYEYDNNESRRQKREALLNKQYPSEYLESIITGTYAFIDKIIKIAENDYSGYIEIPLECEPKVTHISLNLIGGWASDTIVSDSENNLYSISLLKRVFGPNFYIEPCKIEFTEELDEDDDFAILSEIPACFLYIQCPKEVLESVKEKGKVLTKKNNLVTSNNQM